MTTQQAQAKGEIPGADVLRLAELVTYQECSVVSRALLKRASGTVTVFAFDEGQGLSEHTAPFDALVYVLEGSAEITAGGKLLRAKSGEAVLLLASQPRAVKAHPL
jgi:quercetin dioxygenase-like cupin family protein